MASFSRSCQGERKGDICVHQWRWGTASPPGLREADRSGGRCGWEASSFCRVKSEATRREAPYAGVPLLRERQRLAASAQTRPSRDASETACTDVRRESVRDDQQHDPHGSSRDRQPPAQEVEAPHQHEPQSFVYVRGFVFFDTVGLLPDRLVVGRRALDAEAGVRIPVRQSNHKIFKINIDERIPIFF